MCSKKHTCDLDILRSIPIFKSMTLFLALEDDGILLEG